MNTTTIRWNRSQALVGNLILEIAEAVNGYSYRVLDRYKPAPLLVGSAATWGDARALVEQATRELVSSR